MAVAGEKLRRSITLPELTWRELDEEAKAQKCTVSEVLQRYIGLALETQASQMGQLQKMMQVLIDRVPVAPTEMTSPAVFNSVVPAEPPNAQQEQYEALHVMYRESNGGQPPADPFAPEPTPDPPSKPKRWWRRS